jgi:hypothetical protein
MKIRQPILPGIALLLSIALIGSCDGQSSTPTGAFKSFFEAAKKKDAAAMKKTISKRMLAELEDDAKKENKTFDEYLLSVDLSDTMPEVRNEKIKGDTGWLEIKGRGDNWRATKFVREDGEWKLDSDREEGELNH